MSATNAPPAARVGDEIKHKSQVAGLLGALAGAALSGVPFMLGPAGIFVGMLLMADDIGSPMVGQKSLSTKVQEGVEDAVQGFIESCFGEEKYGPIVIGANTVFINDKQAGVAVKPFAVACTRHAPLNQRIAEGSETVFIENFPAARKGDKTECGGVILEGSDNVIIGSGKIAYLEIKSEFHPLIDVVATIVPPSKAGVKSVLSGLGKLIKSPAASAKIGALVLGNAIKKGAGATKQAVGKAKYCISSNANCAKIAFRENKGKGIQRYKETAKKAIFGDPIDVMTGHLVEQRTDFSLGQTLPLTFTRTWARDWPQTIPAGLLGQYWADSFSQTAWVNEAAEYIQVFTEDGAVLQFGLPQGMSQTSNPYHPDYVLIRTGSATFLVKHRITGFCRHFEAVENGTTDAVNSEFDYPKLPIGRYRLSHFSDDYHNQARFIYQESNPTKPVRVEHSEGIQLTLRYHPSGYLHQIVRTDNQSTCLATYQQDSQGHLIESDAVQDFHLYYTYDEHSQLIEWSDRDKTRVNYRYNAQGQCVYSVGANGFYEVWLDYFDGYTQARNLKGTTTFYYDTALLTLTQVVSPTGKITRYAYDLYGNLLTQTLPKGEQLHFTYLEDTGLVKTFTDSLGAMWQYEYEIDDEHQDAYTLIKITDPLNRTWTKTTRFAENGAQQTACFTAPDGSTTEFTRNQYGLLTAIQTTEKQHQRQEHFQYDLRHRLIAQQDAEQRRLTLNYNDQDELTAFTAPKGNSWRYAYTRYGKLQHIQQPNQGGVNYRYDRHGNLLSYTDANQIEWTFRYGAFDLLIEKRDGEGHAWQYEYDKDSLKLTAVINPKGERYQYRYNADDQIDTETDFSGVQWHYGYDDNGNLATLTNSLGETNHYAYNANQQLTQISTEAGECCNYEYDAAGRLTELTTLDTALTFEYDVQDRVIKEVQQHGSQRTTLQWAYPDPQTKIRHIITETEGKTATLTTTYRYNRVGELVQLDLPAEQSGKSETSGQIPQLFCDYDANGNEIARYAPQGFQLRQQYDAMDNLIRQRAGNEPKHFFDKHALQTTGIDAPP
ncbi:PAAR domain-containing protein, partial [Muribacter muris]|uniref:PAAR domain-containing protein n=1 Tax=Muribacter muris TaxID=67855 RepID=UPI00064DC869